jgi:hypothetical protein
MKSAVSRLIFSDRTLESTLVIHHSQLLIKVEDMKQSLIALIAVLLTATLSFNAFAAAEKAAPAKATMTTEAAADDKADKKADDKDAMSTTSK